MLIPGEFWEFCVWAYAGREFTGKSRMRGCGAAGPNMEHQFYLNIYANMCSNEQTFDRTGVRLHFLYEHMFVKCFTKKPQT